MMRSTLGKSIGLKSAVWLIAGGAVVFSCNDLLATPTPQPVVTSALEGRPQSSTGDVDPAAPLPAAPTPAVPVLTPAVPAYAPAVPAAEPRRQSGNPLWAVPLRSLSATRDRPLFSPSRHPPAPAVAVAPVIEAPAPAPAPAVPEQPILTLVGTIIGGESDKIAIFFNPTTHGTVRLRLGESDNGWMLRSVGAREIVLEKNGQTFTLALPSAADAPTQPPQGPEL